MAEEALKGGDTQPASATEKSEKKPQATKAPAAKAAAPKAEASDEPSDEPSDNL